MDAQVLVARRINNGQSEIWREDTPEKRRTVATNGIVYPIRTGCSSDGCAAFDKALETGPAIIPEAVTNQLVSDFGL